MLPFVLTLANFAIFLGYIFVSIFVAPDFRMSRIGKMWGILFFGLCGLTHLELAYHTAIRPFGPEELTSWHMVAIHIPQAVSIWGFVMELTKAVKLGSMGYDAGAEPSG